MKQYWVVLDKKQMTILEKNYYRGWQSGEHLTKFALRIDKEQLQLDADGVVISNANKIIHYMNQIWDCNIFSQDTMKTWGQQTAGLRTYGNPVIYFNNKIGGIELYEAAAGNKSGENASVKQRQCKNYQRRSSQP